MFPFQRNQLDSYNINDKLMSRNFDLECSHFSNNQQSHKTLETKTKPEVDHVIYKLNKKIETVMTPTVSLHKALDIFNAAKIQIITDTKMKDDEKQFYFCINKWV